MVCWYLVRSLCALLYSGTLSLSMVTHRFNGLPKGRGCCLLCDLRPKTKSVSCFIAYYMMIRGYTFLVKCKFFWPDYYKNLNYVLGMEALVVADFICRAWGQETIFFVCNIMLYVRCYGPVWWMFHYWQYNFAALHKGLGPCMCMTL